MIWQKLMMAGGGREFKYLYGCNLSNTSTMTVFKAYRDGTIEYVGHHEPGVVTDSFRDVRVTADGTTAFVANADRKVIVALDVTDPTNIVQIGSLTHATYLNSPHLLSLDEATNRLYVFSSSSEYIGVVDVTNPSSMSLVDQKFVNDMDFGYFDPVNNLLVTFQGYSAYSIVTHDAATLSTQDTDSNSTHWSQSSSGPAVDPVNRVLCHPSTTERHLAIATYTAGGAITWQQDFGPGNDYQGARSAAVDPNRQICFVSVDRAGSQHGIACVDYSNPASCAEVGFVDHTAFSNRTSRIWYDDDWKMLWCTTYSSDRILSIDVSDSADMQVLNDTTIMPFTENAFTLRAAG